MSSVVDLSSDRIELGTAGRAWVTGGAALGVAGIAAALLLAAAGGEGGWRHFYHVWLTNVAYFLSLALGGLFFVLMAHLTRAGWSVTVRRVGEVVSTNVVLMFVLALGLIPGLHYLYEWTHAGEVAHDALLRHKEPYLNEPFFVVRLVLYFAIWAAMAGFYLSRSKRQDGSGDPKLTRRMEILSAPLTIVFAVTLTLASFDLMMSLAPHWFSTIFGVYYFAGSFLGYVSFAVLLLMVLQRLGVLRRVVNTEHYHDLGKLQFAFVVFWAYIAFSQFMLIWYGNLPEETIWYLKRQTGQWTAVSLTLLFGHFVIPFLVLLSRHPKRRRWSLALASGWLLAMHWIDVYWLVMPGAYEGYVPFGLMEIAGIVGMGGLFVAATMWGLGRQPLIPVRDPRLPEAMRFENA